MDMPMPSATPLTPIGVNFSNENAAMNFLMALLDDSTLQIVGNKYAKDFWFGVVALIGLATVLNVVSNVLQARCKRRAASGRLQTTNKDSSFVHVLLGPWKRVKAISLCQFTPVSRCFWIKIPPLGTILLLLCYIGFVAALEFANDSVAGAQFWQARGIRAAWLAVSQVPLIVLLAGKINWIGFLTGFSYERLNVFHRWASRIMMLLAIFHFSFQAHGWSQYPGIFHLEWTTDSCVPTGLAAFCILLWMNLSTLLPVRSWQYEFFVIQHILTFFGFIIAIMMHIPTTALGARIYVYVPVGLYLVDRLIRAARYVWTNIAPVRATLVRGSGGEATTVRFHNTKVRPWTPGSHVLISIPALAFGQSHPATIASTPKSHNGDIVLLLKSHQSFTKRLLAVSDELGKVENSENTYRVLVEGPYGGKQTDLAIFDSICLIAGSTGITFVLSIVQDLAERAASTNGKVPFRRVRIVWAVKRVNDFEWVTKDLRRIQAELQAFGIEVELSLFVTAEAVHEKHAHSSQHQISNRKDGTRGGEYYSAVLSTVEIAESGRPEIEAILRSFIAHSNGRCGVAVCGPFSMATEVRCAVASALLKPGGQDMYLHVEGFSF